MKVLWMTWKDESHPDAGGAEVVNEELAKRLVRDGHEVLFIVGGFDGGAAEEVRDGYRIVRVGGRFSVYWHAYKHYKSRLMGWADVVIDEMNTMPFFARFYVREPVVMFAHQLCREIWFYQMKFPVSLVGYLAEPVYLWMLRKSHVVTISQSTKDDLRRFGFAHENITILPQGMDMAPVNGLSDVPKAVPPRVLSLGSVRPMKRTLEQIKAFEIVRRSGANVQMHVAGDMSGAYGERVKQYVEASPYVADIVLHGRVSSEEKVALMRSAHLITVTSVKEGWGLIVSEAASQGAPAVVYDVDGLRDSVLRGKGGYIAERNTPEALAEAILQSLNEADEYAIMQLNALQFAQTMSFDKSYEMFIATLILHAEENNDRKTD